MSQAFGLKVGDVVRFKYEYYKNNPKGLHEIVDVHDTEEFEYTVTVNECDSEFKAKHKDLILVCSAQDRTDITA
jgi:hypothetical protein